MYNIIKTEIIELLASRESFLKDDKDDKNVKFTLNISLRPINEQENSIIFDCEEKLFKKANDFFKIKVYFLVSFKELNKVNNIGLHVDEAELKSILKTIIGSLRGIVFSLANFIDFKTIQLPPVNINELTKDLLKETQPKENV